jgi:hypothetical protein
MENPAEEGKHSFIELIRPLQRREMGHAGQDDQFRARNASSEILGVFALDEFIVLALRDVTDTRISAISCAE